MKRIALAVVTTAVVASGLTLINIEPSMAYIPPIPCPSSSKINVSPYMYYQVHGTTLTARNVAQNSYAPQDERGLFVCAATIKAANGLPSATSTIPNGRVLRVPVLP